MGAKGVEFAALTGQGEPSRSKMHSAPSNLSLHSASLGRTPPSSMGIESPHTDDPLDSAFGMSTSFSSRSIAAELQAKVIVPSISIRSEYPSIARASSRKGKQVITAMITVEVPPAGERAMYPARSRGDIMSRSGSGDDQLSPQLPPSPRSLASDPYGSVRSTPLSTPDAFSHVYNELKIRLPDYRTSGLDTLGPLRLYDILCVRRSSYRRDFRIYLFQDALLCMSDEKDKKSGIRNIFSSNSSSKSQESSKTGSKSGKGNTLAVRGKMYVRHMRNVVDTSVKGEISLTINMKDETEDSFILVFNDQSGLEVWKRTISRLMDDAREGGHELQSANKIAKLMGTDPTTISAARSTSTSSSFSPHSARSQPSGGLDSSFADMFAGPPPAHSAGAGVSFFSPTSLALPPPPSAGDFTFEQPLAPVHTPLDLVIVLSLPAPTNGSSLPLKVKLMRASLQFVLSLVGPRDRVALVATELGENGSVRKTPFLCTTKYESRKSLEAFVSRLGGGKVEDDEFEATSNPEEHQDVVTAINVALDVVLQRKQKNPVSGMILISDTSDVIRRAQMDLVTARLDAANMPVHSIGYGKSHDPSPLWMVSNHTNGTYTFVREWYHLRDSLAGIIGGLLSVAMTNMKLHLNCQENDFRVIKVSGTSQAVISSHGKEVDMSFESCGMARYGRFWSSWSSIMLRSLVMRRTARACRGRDLIIRTIIELANLKVLALSVTVRALLARVSVLLASTP